MEGAILVTAVLAIIDRLSSLCAALGNSGKEPQGDDSDVIGAAVKRASRR